MKEKHIKQDNQKWNHLKLDPLSIVENQPTVNNNIALNSRRRTISMKTNVNSKRVDSRRENCEENFKKVKDLILKQVNLNMIQKLDKKL